uniref:Transposase n=2 Tax=Candidatus Kentrum sp. DK TaxID=2126562 RepID=A0A450TML7_9GAMM|nr:MAG: Transposase [Candidatus Kentron sp. DK]VFJ69551.1 MAG: Transposase [Candidatus Kentron sp. DK]
MGHKFPFGGAGLAFVSPDTGRDAICWISRDVTKHLARFVVDIVDRMDVSPLEQKYTGGGSAPYSPRMMLALLFYGYATGIFSSRGIERATYELIPVLYITGGVHPDHDSINRFRKRFLGELEVLFVEILEIAHYLDILSLGDISTDGTKIQGNASKHKAMSWKYACELEERLQGEVQELLKRAETENNKENSKVDIPEEIAHRGKRLERIAEVKEEIEKRAKTRYEEEKAEYDTKMEKRKEKEAERGKKLGGSPPKEPEPGPRPKDQVNFTDEDSRIMPTSGGDFVQGYNAQATVDMETMLVIGQYVTQNTNDKQEVEPALAELDKLPEELGEVKRAAFDSGYFSAFNVRVLIEKSIRAFIASGRQPHNQPLEERLAEPPEPPKDADPVTAMQHRMKTEAGKKFYAKRKSTVEPVFGIIKEVMGFRRFMLRGLEAVKGEWTLVCMAFNLKRLCVLCT